MTDNPLSLYVLCEKGFTLRSVQKLVDGGFTLDDFIHITECVQNLNISRPTTVQNIINVLPLITQEELENNLYKLASEGLSERNIQILIQCGLKYSDIAALTKEKLNKLTGSSKNSLFTKVKAAYENIELRLGNTLVSHVYSYIEQLLNKLSPKEKISFLQLIEYVRKEFPDIEEETIQDFLQKKIENDLLIETENGYTKKYKGIIEYLNEDFKNKDILLARMRGMTLQEIGDYYGVTREAIRQKERALIKKIPELEELIFYQNIFTEYEWNEDIFCEIFVEPIEVYQMLNLIYEKGDKQLLEHLDSLQLSSYQKSKILYHFDAFIDYKGEVQFLNNKMALFENMVFYYGKNLINDEVIVTKINEYIKSHQFDEKYLTDITSVRGFTDRSNKIIRDKSNEFRFYDYHLIDEYVLTRLKELIDLSPGVYSMVKIFTENYEFMQEIDIRSEHELHNLYKRLINTDNVSYTRMPEFSVGNIDKNSFLTRLFHEHAPISVDNFIEFIEKNYGLRQNSLRSYIQMYLPEYIHDNEIRVDYVQLTGEDLNKLRQILVEDIYTIEQLNKIGSEIDPDFHDKFLNNMTLMKLGYALRGSYVLTDAYGSVDRYFTDLIMSQDYFVNDRREIYKSLSFNKALYDLEKNLDIVKIENDMYITAKKLSEAGVSKEDLFDFRNQATLLAPEGKYFTLHTLQKAGFMHSLEELGFDSIFYERILWTAPNIRTITLAAGYIFLITNNEISLIDFIHSIVEERISINLYELQDYVKDTFKITLDTSKITALVRDSEMYYSDDMCKIYIDKKTFYEEIY